MFLAISIETASSVVGEIGKQLFRDGTYRTHKTYDLPGGISPICPICLIPSRHFPISPIVFIDTPIVAQIMVPCKLLVSFANKSHILRQAQYKFYCDRNFRGA